MNPTPKSDFSVTINGVAKTLSGPCSVAQMLTTLGLQPEGRLGLAVAVNDEVVPRSRLAHVQIKPQDRIEIIHPVGGG